MPGVTRAEFDEVVGALGAMHLQLDDVESTLGGVLLAIATLT